MLYYFQVEIERAKASKVEKKNTEGAEGEPAEGEVPPAEEAKPQPVQTTYLKIQRVSAEEGLPLMTWEDSEIPLSPVVRVPEMEKANAGDYSSESRALQLTTARPGGDVLALGTDMDEVVFCEHPQLLPLLCIVDKLKHDASEHLIIRGATRYSVLVGQGANLRCDRGVIDTCPIGQDAIRMRELTTCFAVIHKS